METANLKPHEIARLIQEEASKLVPTESKLRELVTQLDDLVGTEEARRLISQPQEPVQRAN